MHVDPCRLPGDGGQSRTVAFEKYDTRKPKACVGWGEGRGAELQRVLASRVAEQQIFLTVKRLRDSRNNSFISLNI